MTVDQFQIWYFKQHRRTENKSLTFMNQTVRDLMKQATPGLTVANYQSHVPLYLTIDFTRQMLLDMYIQIGNEHHERLQKGIESGTLEIKAFGGFETWFEFWTQFMIDYFTTYYSTKIKTIHDSLIRGVVDIITKGINAGVGIEPIKRDLVDKFGGTTGLYGWQMKRIARTETGNAMNLSAFETYRNLGLLVNKVWISALDERVRDGSHKNEFDHLSLHGVEKPIGEWFMVPQNGQYDEPILFPQHESGSAGNVINCRCTIAPKLVYDEWGLPQKIPPEGFRFQPKPVPGTPVTSPNQVPTIIRKKLTGVQDLTGNTKTFDELENSIRDQSFETAIVRDLEGNVLLYKNGAKNFVEFTTEESEFLRDKILTHNHPRGSGFSPADFWMSQLNKPQEVRAVTTTNNFRFTLTEAGRKKIWYERDYDLAMKAINRQKRNAIKILTIKAQNGELTYEQADKLVWVETWNRVKTRTWVGEFFEHIVETLTT